MAYLSHLDKLQAIQNKFMKPISFSDKYDSPYPLFHIHSILKISDIIKLQIASFVYESRMRLSSLEFHTYFTSISELYIVMVQDSLLLKIFFSLEDELHSMVYSYYFGAALWNSIDDGVKKSHSLNAFCRKLKLFYLDSYG